MDNFLNGKFFIKYWNDEIREKRIELNALSINPLSVIHLFSLADF
jgi:hypothetical protein